jgi:hypothetical protein
MSTGKFRDQQFGGAEIPKNAKFWFQLVEKEFCGPFIGRRIFNLTNHGRY